MAYPFSTAELSTAADIADRAEQVKTSATQLAQFLEANLPTGYGNHKVRVAEVTMGGAERDLLLESPLGPLWGRFSVVDCEGEVGGLLELSTVTRTSAGGVALDVLHEFIFNRHGSASFDTTLDGGWDWDIAGQLMAPAAAARTIARILLLKQRQRLRII